MLTAETRLTLTDSVLGTPEYMSPEQARGNEDIDHRTDLYSAGVVLYEMLTGRTPFHADTPSATIHQILHDTPPDPRKLDKNVNPALSTLGLRLMAKSPDDRLASAAEGLGALDADEPVRLPRRPSRRRSRQLLTGVLGVLFLAAAGWWVMVAFGPGPRKIYEVQVHPSSRSIVRAIYDNNKADWEVFYRFPKGVVLNDAVLVDADGQGKQIVVVACARPLDADRNVLVALRPDTSEAWHIPFPEGHDWPDDDDPTSWWKIEHVQPIQIGAMGGQQLVVVAQHSNNQYPARISIVDPRTGALRSTFWHMGHIKGILVKGGFFGPGRPAIIAWGMNNKLDGFDKPDGSEDRRPGDDEPVTAWDIVPVVMILDPQKTQALGPPRSGRLDELGRLLPHAYAFLDLAQSRQAGYRAAGAARRRDPLAKEIACILDIIAIEGTACDGTHACLRVVISRGNTPGGAELKVDRALNLRSVMPLTGERHRDEKYWDDHWQPLVQNGKYVGH